MSKVADKMIYRNLGNTGLKVSLLSYGAWVSFGNQIKLEEVKQIMLKCKEHGVNFFDNAEVYASGEAERLMGQAIKEIGWKRSDIVLTTKLFWGGPGINDKGLSRKHIIEGTKSALLRLQTDYVDVIFCHRPDISTPIEETVRAMNYVLDQGWAFYWGTSEWSAQQIQQAWTVAENLNLVGPCVEQPEYNLFHRERFEVEYAPLYKQYGMGTTIWSPLASGVLTGKYSGGKVPEGSRLGLEIYKGLRDQKLIEKKQQLEHVDQLKPIADSLGCSLAQLAVAWCAKNPNVSTVITGATKLHQLEDNFNSIDVIPKLTPEIMDKIEQIVKTKPTQPKAFR